MRRIDGYMGVLYAAMGLLLGTFDVPWLAIVAAFGILVVVEIRAASTAYRRGYHRGAATMLFMCLKSTGQEKGQ